jgi:hypothetical protein
MLSESSAFIDWHRNLDDDDDGDGDSRSVMSLWQCVMASLGLSDIRGSTVKAMIDRGLGAEFATTNTNGWNALFLFVLAADSPSTGEELNITRILLPVVGDVFTQDCDSLTLFDRVQLKRPARSWMNDERSTKEYNNEAYDTSPKCHGSYQQDLFYCAILRSGLCYLHDLPPLPAGPCFTRRYTPQHYRAMLYLNSWDEKVDPTTFTHPLLSQDSLRDEDRERDPALHEWNIRDLEVMEERLEFATFKKRKRRPKKNLIDILFDDLGDQVMGGSLLGLGTLSTDINAQSDLPPLPVGLPPWPVDFWPLPVAERFGDTEVACVERPGEEKEELGGLVSEWCNDSDEEGGVPVG